MDRCFRRQMMSNKIPSTRSPFSSSCVGNTQLCGRSRAMLCIRVRYCRCARWLCRVGRNASCKTCALSACYHWQDRMRRGHPILSRRLQFRCCDRHAGHLRRRGLLLAILVRHRPLEDIRRCLCCLTLLQGFRWRGQVPRIWTLRDDMQ